MLMRRCGVELQAQSLQTLLRFLVHSKHDPALLERLLARIHISLSAAGNTPRSSASAAMKVSHVECVVLTLLLLERLRPAQRHLALSKPLYHSQNYLCVFPDSQKEVLRLTLTSKFVVE